MTHDVAEITTRLSQARGLLDHPPSEMATTWPRAAAFLARQALEIAVGEMLDESAPGSSEASMRAQLACCSEIAGRDLGDEATWLWNELSRVCHHHAYEISPSSVELTDWITRTQTLVDQIAGLAGSATEQ